MINLHALTNQDRPKVGSTLFVSIDGHGGSGKTTLAKKLSALLDCEVIHTDDFASMDNPKNWWPKFAFIEHRLRLQVVRAKQES